MENNLEHIEKQLTDLGNIDPFAAREQSTETPAQNEQPQQQAEQPAQTQQPASTTDVKPEQPKEPVAPEPERGAEPPEPPKKEEPKLTSEDILLAYLKAQNGEFGDRSQQIERDAKILLEDIPIEDWIRLREKADAGEYGAQSEDIKALVREYLPIVQARDIIAREEEARERQEQERQLKELQAKQVQSYEKAAAKYPDLKQENSPFRQHVEAIIKDFIFDGTDPNNPKQGPLFGLLSLPNWPELVADLASRSYQLVLQYPYSTVKPKQVVIRGAEPSGNPSSGARASSRLEQLEAQLASMGKIKI